MMYVPVQTKSFDKIEILLRSDTGLPIPFERGKVLATLHFRQQIQPILCKDESHRSLHMLSGSATGNGG